MRLKNTWSYLGEAIVWVWISLLLFVFDDRLNTSTHLSAKNQKLVCWLDATVYTTFKDFLSFFHPPFFSNYPVLLSWNIPLDMQPSMLFMTEHTRVIFVERPFSGHCLLEFLAETCIQRPLSSPKMITKHYYNQIIHLSINPQLSLLRGLWRAFWSLSQRSPAETVDINSHAHTEGSSRVSS